MFLIAFLFAADLLVFTTRLGAHLVLLAAAVISSHRQVDAFQFATAIMQVDGHSAGGKAIHQQEQYDKSLFHTLLQTYAKSGFVYLILISLSPA